MNRQDSETDTTFADRITVQLASDLDAGNHAFTKTAAELLLPLPYEVVLPAIKKNVGLERLVKNNLDEDPDFGKVLSALNTAHIAAEEAKFNVQTETTNPA